jgi:hypothetical protein
MLQGEEADMRIPGKNRVHIKNNIIYLPVEEISPNPVQPGGASIRTLWRSSPAA